VKHEVDHLPHAEIKTVHSSTSTAPHASCHRLQRDIFTYILLCWLETVGITTFTPTIYAVNFQTKILRHFSRLFYFYTWSRENKNRSQAFATMTAISYTGS